MLAEINSNKVIDRYNILWRLVGFPKNPTIYSRAYALFLTIVVTILYPTHLIIRLLMVREPKELFRNLMINVAVFASTIKYFSYLPQFGRMKDISRLLVELDKHVLTKEDREFHNDVLIMAGRIVKLFVTTYEIVCVSCLPLAFLGEQPGLIYPAWFPFDWKRTTWTHVAAVFYQYMGYQMHIIQNIAEDTYVPLGLCLLSGHTQLLERRLARVGYDENKTEKEHYADLIECFQDFERLKRFFFQLQETISVNVLLQSVTNGVNFCVCIIFVVFYAEDYFEYGFAFFLAVGLSVQFYPGCYYGSCVEKSFYDLTYALFSCNWVSRNVVFRRTQRIFTEVTLPPATMFAKNVVKIHLDTYFNTMRLSYSLFCLVLRLK